MPGYAGKILRINLSSKKHSVEPLDESLAKKYIGGVGLAVKLFVDSVPANADALGPENVLVLATGPLSGTMAPAGGNGHAFSAKSPLTNGIGVATAQGFFGAEVKRAGYDAVVFKGKCEVPTYLWIDDDSVQFLDAHHLWGKSPAETEEMIREELGDQCIRVTAIGAAGEKLARIACILNDRTGVAGRAGMGAVMGSKNLKAIAVRGSKDVAVANSDGFLDFCKAAHEKMKGPITATHRSLGSASDILVQNAAGCLPTRNFSAGFFESAQKISGERFNEKYVAGINACPSCPMRCEHIAVVRGGPYRGAYARVEYGPVWAFGPQCGIDRLDAIVKAMDVCSFYGLDAVSTGNIVGFAMDCFESGAVPKERFDGLDMRFGNHEAMLEMVSKIGKREGVGDLLAEGVRRAAEKFGGNAVKLANHVKGIEMTGQEVRCSKADALGYAVTFRGPYNNLRECNAFDIKEGTKLAQKPGAVSGRAVMESEDLYAAMDSLIVCRFTECVYRADGGVGDLAKLYSLATGIEMSPGSLKLVGERINNLARAFNAREGFSRKDDSLPPKLLSTPIPRGPSKGSVVASADLDILLDDYYAARGWTREGVPTEAKLKELGIEDASKMLKTKAAGV